MVVHPFKIYVCFLCGLPFTATKFISIDDPQTVVLQPNEYQTYHVNKKVLLHERKRHTARCVASALSAALSPEGERGTPIQSQRGVPPSSPDGGGTPIQSRWGYPHLVPTRGGYPGSPSARWSILPLSGWMGITPPPPTSSGRMGVPDGVPLPHRCEQTENITFPYPSDAGGNNRFRH